MDHVPRKKGNVVFPLLSWLGKGLSLELSDREEKGGGKSRLGHALGDMALGTSRLSNLILFNGLCNLVINLVIGANVTVTAGNKNIT